MSKDGVDALCHALSNVPSFHGAEGLIWDLNPHCIKYAVNYGICFLHHSIYLFVSCK